MGIDKNESRQGELLGLGGRERVSGGAEFGSQSVGQQRMRALHNGSRDSLTVAPNLWAGYGLVRGGAATGTRPSCSRAATCAAAC